MQKEEILKALAEVQHYHAFKLLYNVLCLCAVSLLEIARNIVYTLAVGDRHHDALIYCTLVLLYLLDDRPSNTLDTVGLALECSHCALEGALDFTSVGHVIEPCVFFGSVD